MKSMTGLGLGAAPLGDGRLLVELRSLNHRFVDVRVRVPPELGEHSFFVEQLAREQLERGRYDIGVRTEGAAMPPPTLSLDRAKAVYASLAELRDELAPGTELPISALVSLPDVVASAPTGTVDQVRNALRAAFTEALESLALMRSSEGDALETELRLRLERAERCREQIADHAPAVTESYRRRLREKLDRLVLDAGVELDANRLEMEVALLAERSDITEELVRLASHFDQFGKLLGFAGPIGRKLDFLLQEISREANTIGSKIQDASVAHLVVELKADVERIREQVQNVE